VLTAPLYVEMLTTSAAVGAAWHSWDAEDTDVWVNSWRPVFGEVIAQWTKLPVSLSFWLMISMCANSCSVWTYVRRARRNYDLCRRGGYSHAFLLNLTAAADAANLGLLASTIFAVQSAMKLKNSLLVQQVLRKDRSTKLVVRVIFGMLPRLWLKISLLADRFSPLGTSGRLMLVVAISISLFSLLEPTYDQIVLTYHNGRQLNRTLSLKNQWWFFYFHCLLLTVETLVVLTCVVRFVGVWSCTSHVFQTSSMTCMPACE